MRLPQTISQPSFFVVIAISLQLMTGAHAAKVPTGNADSHAAAGEVLTRTPIRLQFGEVFVGQAKNAFATITNRSGSSLTVLGATSTGAGFTLNGLNLPLILSGGESYTFSVTFAPQVAGAADGTISFISEASKKSLTMKLMGTGAGRGQLSIAPAIIASSKAENSTTEQLVKASMVGTYNVRLSWKASTSKHIVGYNIYRSNQPHGPYQRINRVLDPDTNFTDIEVVAGHTYYYRATAVNWRKRESADSKQIWVAVP